MVDGKGGGVGFGEGVNKRTGSGLRKRGLDRFRTREVA